MQAECIAAVNTREKERLRTEISDQIAEFLRNGGIIEVLANNQQHRADLCQSSSEWPGQANGYGA